MSTIQEVKAAEKRMQEAERELRAYTERPENEPQDTEKHLRLTEALREARDEYMVLVSEVNS